MGISTLLFLAVTGSAGWAFARKLRLIRAKISLGQPVDRQDRSGERWVTMARVALGQSKMGAKPLPALLHLLVYVGFVLINIEVLKCWWTALPVRTDSSNLTWVPFTRPPFISLRFWRFWCWLPVWSF